MNTRRWNVIFAVCTIAVGLSVHRGVLPLSATARDVLGDALWAMMIVWLTGVLAPRASLRARALAALAICFVVELSQLARTPALDALRRTLPGHLVLGSGFDPRDFVAYTAGVVLTASLIAAASLTLRSLLWTILLPGVMAGYVPWRYFGLRSVRPDPSTFTDVAGVVLVAAGAVLLAACIFEFARSGKGTLSPLDPPRELVVGGLYRYVRNPMYLGVTTILIGEGLLIETRNFVIYSIVWFAAVNLFVMGYEEPTLRNRFGHSYERYTRQVGRWLPRPRRGNLAC